MRTEALPGTAPAPVIAPAGSTDAHKPAAAPRKSKGLRRAKRVGWNLLPPLTFVAIVALWAAAIPIFKIPPYLLPGPGGVFSRVISDAPMLWTHSLVTLTEILLGFGLTVLTMACAISMCI